MVDQFFGTDFMPTGDVALAYRVEGTGDPVVLVHGGVSDLRTWSKQVPVLGQHFRTIAYSRRFARPNDDILDGEDDQMQPHVDDLANFIQSSGATPSHLVGHSWGAFIVLLAAIQHPELVRSIVLIEPPVLSLFIDLPPKPRQVLSLLMKAPRTAVAILKLGRKVMSPAEKAFRRGDDKAAIEIFGKGVLGASRFSRLSPERMQQVWDNRKTEKAQMLGAGFPPLVDADVRTATVPALLLAGDASPYAFRRMSERLGDLLPNARLVVIDGASHIVHEDAPEKTNEILVEFLMAH